MSETLYFWLNNELKLSEKITNIQNQFSNGFFFFFFISKKKISDLIIKLKKKKKNDLIQKKKIQSRNFFI